MCFWHFEIMEISYLRSLLFVIVLACRFSRVVSTCTELSAQNGNITSPNYKNNFKANVSKCWTIPLQNNSVSTCTELSAQNGNITSPNYKSNCEANVSKCCTIPLQNNSVSMVVLHIVENKLLFVNIQNNKNFVTGNLIVEGVNIALLAEGSCVFLLTRGHRCCLEDVPETSFNCTKTIVIYLEESTSTLEINFNSNNFPNKSMPRYFKLKYEVLGCEANESSAISTPTTTSPLELESQHPGTTDESASPTDKSDVVQGNSSDKETQADKPSGENTIIYYYAMIALAGFAGVEAVALVCLICARCKGKNPGPRATSVRYRGTSPATDQCIIYDTPEYNVFDTPSVDINHVYDMPPVERDTAHVTPTRTENAYEMDQRQMVVNELYNM